MIPTVAEVRDGFVALHREARPMVRWWWFGPDVVVEEVERELTLMEEAGFGGAEIAYVYPLTEPADADEPGGLFWSQRFRDVLHHAVRYGHALGLRMDLSLGSGWPLGGSHITSQHAARTLHWDVIDLFPGVCAIPTTAQLPGDEFVAAFLMAGSRHEPMGACQVLWPIGEVVVIPDGSGPRHLMIARSRLTGQNVKRAASGVEGAVLDHYSEPAVRCHLEQVGSWLLDGLEASLVGSVFSDSLEVYEANWTATMPEEFRSRRGYDLLPWLYLLRTDAPRAQQLRADFHRTLTELFEEHFVDVIQAWLSARGHRFRMQGYGSPPASVSSNRADMVEGEGWGWRFLTAGKWAASTAHERNLSTVSAETWTWVHSPSFRATPLDLLAEAHEHLLTGINHFIGHGWPSQPGLGLKDSAGIGAIFYASGALDERNAWWPVMRQLTDRLARLAWVMRQGTPEVEITVLLPIDDIRAGLTTDLNLLSAARDWVGDSLTAAIREGGWDYVVVDDAVTCSEPVPRPVIVVPRATRLAPALQGWLEGQCRLGSQVILMGGRAELEGACQVSDCGAGIVNVLRELCPPSASLVSTSHEVGVRRRKLADGEIHLVVNTGSTRQHLGIRGTEQYDSIERWDPQDGSTTPLKGQLELEPYEAALLVLGPSQEGDDDAPPELRFCGSVVLTRWRLCSRAPHLGAGCGIEEPVNQEVTLPHCWEEDPEFERFCGLATYETEFTLPSEVVAVTLDLGSGQSASSLAGDVPARSYRVELAPPLGEVAEIVVNDEALGWVWHPPYRLDLGGAIRPGRNHVVMKVYNTSAHALAEEQGLAERSRRLVQRYGWRFANQDLASAEEGLRSGLLVVPVIHLYRAQT